MNQNLDFHALKQSLIDIIQESQIKVGYSNTSIGLYYPLESLNRLLDVELSVAEMEDALREFGAFAKDTLGETTFTRDGGLFCITIPAEGVTYVHDRVEDSGFLRDFIERIACHPCGIDDLLAVFRRYSNCVKCEKIDNDEFDYLVYFEDGKPDAYRYCIKEEMGHATYHRFTQKDYDSFGF